MHILLKKIIPLIFVSCTIQANTHELSHHLASCAYQAIQNDQLVQACELYNKILTMNPSDSTAHYNCGYIYTRLNQHINAAASYSQALTLTPHNNLAKLGLSKSLLACGQFSEAWPLFEARLAHMQSVQQALGYMHFSIDTCAGKKILLRSEWGLGDMVHFVRYAKLLHNKGAYVIVQIFDPLVKLFSACTYIDRVISLSDPIPPVEIQIPMLSLPMLFNTTIETIPAPIPYLYADKKLIKHWKSALTTDTYTIGICWHAKPIYLEDHISTRRSIPLTQFEPLAHLPVTFYSLQKEYGMEEAQSCSFVQPMPIDFDESHGRFMDTAALIMNMDLIISADTSIVHIAGALGKEVWVLLPYAAEWRWLPGLPGYESRTPWYPNMKLFRQKNPGDWKLVVEEVKNKLAEKLVHKK